MPPLQCAACATPLRPDAAGHGHYRMKSAAVGAVAACSRPCGAIGLMLAAIGAPPTKRTAGDAELAANEPKAGRGGCDDQMQRDADYRQAEAWLRVITATVQWLSGNLSGTVASNRIKTAAMMVGNSIEMANYQAIDLLRPIVDAIYALMLKIRDPACPPYAMSSVSDVVHNVVRRITQQEQYESIKPALFSDSRLSEAPADIRRMVAQYTAPVDMPLFAKITLTIPFEILAVHCGQRFIYVLQEGQTSPNEHTCRVYDYAGVYVNSFVARSDAGAINTYFEPDDVDDQGELITVAQLYKYNGGNENDKYSASIANRTGITQLNPITIPGVQDNYESADDNSLLVRLSVSKYQRLTVSRSGIHTTTAVIGITSRLSENTADGDIFADAVATRHGFTMPYRSASDGAYGRAVIDFEKQSIDIVSIAPEMDQSYIVIARLPDGSFIVITNPIAIARYRNLSAIEFSDFKFHLDEASTFTSVRVHGYRCLFHEISYRNRNIDITVVDLRGIPFAD